MKAPIVLIVEDEVLIRMAIADYLRDCGFTVVEAGNAAEAMAVLELAVPIDVVFTDVQMPGEMDGFGLAQWARANQPGVDIIITSGVTRAAEKASGLCAEGPLVRKPYEHVQVENRIRLLLAARAKSVKPEQ